MTGLKESEKVREWIDLEMRLVIEKLIIILKYLFIQTPVEEGTSLLLKPMNVTGTIIST